VRPTLKLGDVGEDVSDLQRQLSLITSPDRRPYLKDDENYSDVKGEYNRTTRLAVAFFQRDHGLPATGVCDEETWDAIGKAFDETEIEF
jgi:murein L,D-transpeptidase YcbB/YkuD